MEESINDEQPSESLLIANSNAKQLEEQEDLSNRNSNIDILVDEQEEVQLDVSDERYAFNKNPKSYIEMQMNQARGYQDTEQQDNGLTI